MLGALVREGGLLNARRRYFDAERRRAGVAPDVAALVSELADRRTVVTLVNLSKTDSRTLVMPSGAYGEHRIASIAWNGRSQRVGGSHVTVQIAPGAGAKLTLAMRRHANKPTVGFPWDRS